MDENAGKSALAGRFIEAYGKMQRMKLHTVHPELSQGEYYLLATVSCLSDADDRVHVAALVEKQHVSPQAVSKMLRGLERRKFIRRIVSSSDRRTSLVQLTDKGRELLDEASATAGKFADHVIGSMGEQKVEQLLSLLQELDCAVQDETVALDGELRGGDL